MKWLIISVILGVVEVWTLGQLHPVLGTAKLVGLYLATTALGAVFLYLQLPALRAALDVMKKLDKQWKKKLNNPEFKPTAEDIQKLKPMVFVGVYFPALVLIAIPGIVSDVIGILLVLPVISNWYVSHKMNQAMRKALR
jgi:UPF0716 family protein affecting phage T7 exclusion